MTRRSLLVAGLAGAAIAVPAIVLTLGLVSVPWRASSPVDHGRAIYSQYCASCHGANLEGQPNWQRRNEAGRMPAPPHDETGHTWHHGDRQLFAITKYGVERFAPAGYGSDMPGFENTLSDAEIDSVLAFIRSTWPGHIRARQAAVARSEASR